MTNILNTLDSAAETEVKVQSSLFKIKYNGLCYCVSVSVMNRTVIYINWCVTSELLQDNKRALSVCVLAVDNCIKYGTCQLPKTKSKTLNDWKFK